MAPTEPAAEAMQGDPEEASGEDLLYVLAIDPVNDTVDGVQARVEHSERPAILERLTHALPEPLQENLVYLNNRIASPEGQQVVAR